jgi:hypothetical protein
MPNPIAPKMGKFNGPLLRKERESGMGPKLRMAIPMIPPTIKDKK